MKKQVLTYPATPTASLSDIADFLDRDEQKDLLRLLTAGSVDDGKSTLIGRLLYDSKKLYEDQLDALEKDTQRYGNAGGQIDYALLLDGLKAEREQGITIDVAYRYFATNKRKFIIADTPGHEQYTRNMITGGSTANLAIILVDACNGVITQTRRHSYLVSLLGIKHVVLAVNKMDLTGYRQDVFRQIVADYKAFSHKLNIPDLLCIPLSALKGDNIVEHSANMPWYKGPSLLEFLENVPIDQDLNFQDFRYPVQYVLRPDASFRGFSGNVASGIIKQGDEVVALPSLKKSRVKSIVTYDGNQSQAFPPQAITLTLEDEIDLSRGEMLVHPDNIPAISRNFEAMLVWMDEKVMDPEQLFYIKHTTATSRVKLEHIHYKMNINTMEKIPATPFSLNEIGRVTLTTAKPLFLDLYLQNKKCGSFILIDPVTNNTCGVGFIVSTHSGPANTIQQTLKSRSLISPAERRQQYKQKGRIHICKGEKAEQEAYQLEKQLFNKGHIVVVLNQKETTDLENMARTLCQQGLIVICIY